MGLVASLACLVAGVAGADEARFPTSDEFADRIARLVGDHPGSIRRTELAPGLPLLEVGRVPDSRRLQEPAMLVVGGLEPDDATGPLVALGAVEALVVLARTNEATRQALESGTVYVLPRLMSGPFPHQRSPRDERSVQPTPPVDDDHDGLIDEDGPEDVNGDGWITSLRVEDPSGEFIEDPVDPRLLLKADPVRGEKGRWRLLTEGRDQDGDEAWNEDGPGGLNPNRNFAANYAFFGPGAGPHPMSDTATRALADFVIARPHIGVAFALGAADNLTEAPKAEPGNKRPLTTVHEGDLPWLKEFGAIWRRAVRLEKEVAGATAPGTFSDWFYLHRGRLALAARPWFPGLAPAFVPPIVEADKPATEAATNAPSAGPVKPAGKEAASPKGGPKTEPDKRNEDERAFLRWLDTNAPSAFLPWQRMEHPDFPGKRVEVGGLVPGARTRPPERWLGEVVRREAGGIADVLTRLPRVAVRRTEVRALGHGVYDVRVEVANTGFLPTVLAHGERTGEVLPTRVTLGVEDSAVLSGTRVVPLPPIPGSGGWKEARWVVLVPDRKRLEVEVVSALGGRARATLDLTEESR